MFWALVQLKILSRNQHTHCTEQDIPKQTCVIFSQRLLISNRCKSKMTKFPQSGNALPGKYLCLVINLSKSNLLLVRLQSQGKLFVDS